MALQMAMENPRIKADVIEASEFPHMVQRYKVMGVPKTVINEKVEFAGAVPEARFLAEVMKAQNKQEAS